MATKEAKAKKTKNAKLNPPKAGKKDAADTFVVVGPRTHGKKYRAFAQTFDRQKKYPLSKALEIISESAGLVKFDPTCEIHMKINSDPAQADQLLRGTVVLPHGTGKKVRVIAFVDESKVKEAKEAGAVEAGTETLIEKIEDGWLEFDVAIASPDQMKSLGKVAKTLGQKGLMPNPKAGTVSPNIKETIGEIIKGKIEFRLDKQANLHNALGKVSFGKEKLADNIRTYIRGVQEGKPSGIKGALINTATLNATMGPGVKLDLSKLQE